MYSGVIRVSKVGREGGEGMTEESKEKWPHAIVAASKEEAGITNSDSSTDPGSNNEYISSESGLMLIMSSLMMALRSASLSMCPGICGTTGFDS